jgi:hypothetical protein
MNAVLRVGISSIAAVAQRPGLVLTAYLATVLVAAPVAAVLSHRIEPALPGFAAPLDNLSAVFDLSSRPVQTIAGAVVYGLVWVLLWGAALEVFAREAGGRGLLGGARTFWFPMLKLTLVALGAYAVVFVVLHPLLFGWMFGMLTANVDSEPTALVIRVALYTLFAIVLAAISLTIDYARVQTVVFECRHTFDALRASVDFVRRHTADVVGLLALTALGFAGLLFGYYAFDRVTRGASSVTSVVLAGQAFIVGRLVLRLVYAAAEVHLVIASRTADTSSGAVARSE